MHKIVILDKFSDVRAIETTLFEFLWAKARERFAKVFEALTFLIKGFYKLFHQSRLDVEKREDNFVSWYKSRTYDIFHQHSFLFEVACPFFPSADLWLNCSTSIKNMGTLCSQIVDQAKTLPFSNQHKWPSYIWCNWFLPSPAWWIHASPSISNWYRCVDVGVMPGEHILNYALSCR